MFSIDRVNYCINGFQGNMYDYPITAECVVIRATGLHLEVGFDPETKQTSLLSLNYTGFSTQGRVPGHLFRKKKFFQSYFECVFSDHFV